MSIKNELIPKRRFKEFENADAWEQRMLPDFVEFYNGQTYTPADVQEFGTLVLRSSNIRNGEVIDADNVYINSEKATAEQVKEGDIIVVVRNGSRALIGKHAEIKENMPNTVIGAFMTGLRSGQPSFLNALLETTQFEQEIEKNMGATINQITGYMFSKMSFMTTGENEQEAVGNYFKEIDNLITLHQRKLDKLKETKIAYVSEMFPKEGNLKPKRRFKGYKDEWESINLDQIATMNARIGWQNLRTSEFLKEGDYMLITGTDFENGKVDFSTCHFVSKERYEQDTNIQVQNGSILITKDGTLGKVAYVEDLEKPATLNAGVFNVRIKDQNKVDEVFLFQYLRAPFLMRYVNERATGGTIKHLNQNILVKFPILLPEKEEQIRIGKFLTKLDKMIESQQRVLSKLIDLKNAYLNEMFV